MSSVVDTPAELVVTAMRLSHPLPAGPLSLPMTAPVPLGQPFWAPLDTVRIVMGSIAVPLAGWNASEPMIGVAARAPTLHRPRRQQEMTGIATAYSRRR